MRNRQGYDKNHKDRQNNDFYATPPREVKNILQYEKLYGTILDNSCGEGHIIKPVKEKYSNNKILATDLIDRGFGEGGYDFLSDSYPYDNVDTIIMNPPFSLITEFVLKSLEVAKKKIVLLAQLQFLESQKRYKKIFKEYKPNRIYIYVDRVACAINGNFDKAKSSSMTYSWIIWDKVNSKHKFDWIRRWNKIKSNKRMTLFN